MKLAYSPKQIRENLKKLETELETARKFPHPPSFSRGISFFGNLHRGNGCAPQLKTMAEPEYSGVAV